MAFVKLRRRSLKLNLGLGPLPKLPQYEKLADIRFVRSPVNSPTRVPTSLNTTFTQTEILAESTTISSGNPRDVLR